MNPRTNSNGSNADVQYSEEYMEAAVHRMLAEHTEIADQGISVVRRDHVLTLHGEVESPKRRDEIVRLVTEHFPEVQVRCDIGLIRTHPPNQAEELA